MKKLLAYRMRSGEHPLLVERLRKLYIGALEQLATHPIASLSEVEQQSWYARLDHTRVTLHLYSPIDRPWEIVAFSQVTDRGNHCTPMFAIARHMHGQGLGREIIQHYLEIAAGKPLRGEQLVSNGAICHLNQKLGWQVVGENEGTQFLRHPNNVDRQQEVYDEMVRYWEST